MSDLSVVSGIEFIRMSDYRYGSSPVGGGGQQADNAAIMERVNAELALAEAKEIIQVSQSHLTKKQIIFS